jgi:hypothetical protein
VRKSNSHEAIIWPFLVCPFLARAFTQPSTAMNTNVLLGGLSRRTLFEPARCVLLRGKILVLAADHRTARLPGTSLACALFCRFKMQTYLTQTGHLGAGTVSRGTCCTSTGETPSRTCRRKKQVEPSLLCSPARPRG